MQVKICKPGPSSCVGGPFLFGWLRLNLKLRIVK
uniref:Uncharacterized protein n=1 Tax=Rhizophora mucronata TaxID=61149 RepID=A0A2P2NH18_RHIMU